MDEEKKCDDHRVAMRQSPGNHPVGRRLGDLKSDDFGDFGATCVQPGRGKLRKKSTAERTKCDEEYRSATKKGLFCTPKVR